MLPFEDIPVDLVPLTAHFKHLLTYASQQQPLLLFLDSVDQLTGAQDANKVSWLPLRLPPYCKVNNFIFSTQGENCHPAPNQLSIISTGKLTIRGFSPPPSDKCRDRTLYSTPNASFPIQYWLIILPFDAVELELLITPLSTPKYVNNKRSRIIIQSTEYWIYLWTPAEMCKVVHLHYLRILT
jgi:hypothetical protein